MPHVSIIVINHDGRRFLNKCLSSLTECAYPDFDVIMVDNASEDDSVSYVSKMFSSVRIERSEVNLGYAGGCNKGADIAQGDFLVFMNSDVVVSKGWLEVLVETCSRPGVAVCGGRILIEGSGAILYSAGGALNLFSVPIDRGLFEIDKDQFNRLEDVAYVSGAVMMVDKRIFEKLRGFDSNFFAFCEEVDLCLRARIAGYRVMYNPSSIAYHAFGGSFGRPSPYRRFFGVRNMIFTLIKILQLRNLILLLPIYLAFRYFEAIALTLTGRVGYLASFILAIASSISKSQVILEDRRKIQQTRRVDDSAVLSFIVPLKYFKYLFRRSVLKSVI